jgi:hypothetical protein
VAPGDHQTGQKAKCSRRLRSRGEGYSTMMRFSPDPSWDSVMERSGRLSAALSASVVKAHAYGIGLPEPTSDREEAHRPAWQPRGRNRRKGHLRGWSAGGRHGRLPACRHGPTAGSAAGRLPAQFPHLWASASRQDVSETSRRATGSPFRGRAGGRTAPSTWQVWDNSRRHPHPARLGRPNLFSRPCVMFMWARSDTGEIDG